MKTRTGLKLYLLAGLSILSLILASLVLSGVIAAENSGSVGFQYLFVGVGLGVLFLYFGGFIKLRSQPGTLGRLTPTHIALSGDDSEQSTHKLERPVGGPGGGQLLADEPMVEIDIRDPNRARLTILTSFGAPGIEPSVRWNIADEVVAAVRQNEAEFIDRLIDEGMVTIEGPITERDVRAMVWVAISTIELSDYLLTGVADQTDGDLAGGRRPTGR